MKANELKVKVLMVRWQSSALQERRLSLKDWLSKINITVVDLCAILGIHRSFYYYICAGKRNVSEKLLKKLRILSCGRVKTIEAILSKS